MAFPSTALGVEVSLAFGADLSANPATWSWTDISTYVRYAPGIEITAGRRDETSESQPAECAVVLDNTSGRFTPRNPNSPYYPNVRFNTPLRIRVDPGTGYSTRFIGFVDEWPLRWDLSGNEKRVEVTASGLLRRLNQAGELARSALYRATIDAGPTAYWPLEDGEDATQAASAVGGTAMTGTLLFGKIDGPGGSAPVLDVTNRGQLAAPVPGGIWNVTDWRVEFIARVPAEDAATSGGVILLEWSAPGQSGDITYYRVTATTSGTIIVTYFLYGTTVGTDITATVDPFDGRWRHYRVDGFTSGGTTSINLYIDGVGVAVGNPAADGYGPNMVKVITAVTTADDCLPGIGHVAVWHDPPVSSDTTDAWDGWVGETSVNRVIRICGEEGIYYSPPGASGEPEAMGPQPLGPALEIFRDCELADAGLLYDTSGGISFRPHAAQYNQAVALALNCADGDVQHPLEANDDDQQIANDVTASRPDGSPYAFTDTDGPLGTAAVGTYSDSLTVNVETDAAAEQRAAWRVGLGTVDELRFPQVGLNFARSPGLVAAWLATTIGERVTISNPPAELPAGAGDPDLLMVGYTEYMSPKNWAATLNTVPYRPYEVIELDAGDNESRLDAEASGVWIGVASGATSVKVYNVDETVQETWTTAAGDLPFDVGAAGERMTVTGVANNAITFVAAGAVAHANNASVSPALPAGFQEGDLLLLFAAIRGTSATVNGPGDWSDPMLNHGHIKIFAKKATGLESAPTVTFTGGAAGDDTSAQICAFRNATKLLGVTHLSNGSAQDIAYPGRGTDRPGSLIIYAGWKQDDWTSVASPGTEIGEPDTTTGNDQGIVWSYTIQTTAADIAAASFVVTGGAAAVSKSGVLQIAGSVQTLTVTRAVNGVTKAQTQDTQVSLWQPHVIAL